MEWTSPELQFQVFIDDLRLPGDALVGDEDGGLVQLFAGLNPERIMAASFSTGLARFALEKATAYAKERTVFQGPIGSHQAIAHPLAESHIEIEMARLMTQKAAALYDAGDDMAAGEAANMAKYAAAEAACNAADRAVQTHGGNGATQEYGVAGLLVATRVGRIAPVSREMILNFVAMHSLGLPKSVLTSALRGMRACHMSARADQRQSRGRAIAVGPGYKESSFHCPSETTSTVPSVTLLAVCSSRAYAGSDDAVGPALRLGQGVRREEVQMREDREVARYQGRSSGADGHSTSSRRSAGYHHAAGADPYPDRVGQRRQGRPIRLPHPVVTGTSCRRRRRAARHLSSSTLEGTGRRADCGRARSPRGHRCDLPFAWSHAAPG